MSSMTTNTVRYQGNHVRPSHSRIRIILHEDLLGDGGAQQQQRGPQPALRQRRPRRRARDRLRKRRCPHRPSCRKQSGTWEVCIRAATTLLAFGNPFISVTPLSQPITMPDSTQSALIVLLYLSLMLAPSSARPAESPERQSLFPRSTWRGGSQIPPQRAEHVRAPRKLQNEECGGVRKRGAKDVFWHINLD